MATPEKAIGIVLRVIEFSETSSIVTLFTREFGKITGLAKGARRPKGPFESALDLLALVRLVFLRKSSDVLDLLTEAKLERRFRPSGRNLSSLYSGYYVAELLGELTDDYDPHPELFDLAAQTLLEVSTGGPVPSLVLHFELGALRALGHLPSFAACAECGKPIERFAENATGSAGTSSGRIAFSPLAGGVLCNDCRVGKKQVVAVSAGVLRALARFAEADSEMWRRIELDSRTSGELRAVLNHYLANLLGHKPRMVEYLGTLSD